MYTMEENESTKMTLTENISQNRKMKSKTKPKAQRYYEIDETTKVQDVYKINVKKLQRIQNWKLKQKELQSHQDGKHNRQDGARRQHGGKPSAHRRSEAQSDHKGQKSELKQIRKKKDPFPGEKPVPKEKMKKYDRGKMADVKMRTGFHTSVHRKREQKMKTAVKQAVRVELLAQEESGFLETHDDDPTVITQHDIAGAVDVASSQKFFELTMNSFGPYRINYTRNGRFLLCGGRKGHVAAIDWMTKKLLCEINVMETLHDVRWLHQETMYAVAQKQWTYIYDNQGIELHCLKVLDSVLRMEFLPYHFLLAAANAKGYLSYIDVSVGEKVAGYGTQMGRLDVMCQNPNNAVTCLGHTGGTVTMWCPTVKQPVMKMLCHGSGVRSISIDKEGQYMATSGIDRKLNIWDLRTYKMLHSYKMAAGAGHLAFSQTGMLAAGIGNTVQIFQDCCTKAAPAPYLVHNLTSSVNSLNFCPYEDVLGVGHGNGFSSLLVPGAGEANFDALEANPYQTKKQRREAEVQMLLEKIQPEMIQLDTGVIGQVDKSTMETKIVERNKLLSNKPQKMEFEPRYKMKGRSKVGKKEKRKRGVVEENKREQVKDMISEKRKEDRKVKQNEQRQLGAGSVLDRFKRKDG